MPLDQHDFASLYGSALVQWADAHMNDPQYGATAKAIKTDQGYFQRYIDQNWAEYTKNPKAWAMQAQGNTSGYSVMKYADQRLTNPDADPAGDASKASASDLLREFAMHMMAPIDDNDPYVQQVVRAASGSAQTDARNRGLQGGYAVANGERAVAGATTAAQLQRNQLGAQAMGQAGQLDLGQANLAMQQYQLQYQAQMQQEAARQANGQAVGSAIGAVAGAVGSAYGVPGLNVQSGAQFGGGIGGLASGGAPSYQYTPPALGGNKRGGV